MRLEARAAVLSVKRLGSGMLVRTLTQDHGKVSGLASPPSAKRPGPQPGYTTDLVWRSRLPEQLGRVTWETAEPFAAMILCPRRLATLASALALTDEISRERDPLPCVYAGLVALMRALADEDDRDALLRYPVWEARALADAGYPLSVEACAGGGGGPVIYVSPNTGAGVSEEAGAPYKHKLLALPPSFREALMLDEPAEEWLPAVACAEDALAALALTGFFWERRVFDGMLARRVPQRLNAAAAFRV